MQVKIQNKPIAIKLMQVPDLNFGQFQRWKEHEPLVYQLEVETPAFVNIIEKYFNEFRKTEIEDDDQMDLEELIAFKNLGFPTLQEMLTNHKEILADLLIFNSQEVLQLLFNHDLTSAAKRLYSVNSIDTIFITSNSVDVSGICFLVKR